MVLHCVLYAYWSLFTMHHLHQHIVPILCYCTVILWFYDGATVVDTMISVRNETPNIMKKEDYKSQISAQTAHFLLNCIPFYTNKNKTPVL